MKATLSRIWLALLGVALALGVGFIGLRLLQGQPSQFADCQMAPGNWEAVVEPLLKSYHDPCSQFRYRGPEDSGSEFDLLVHFNNFGLHAPDYVLAKPADTFRILIIGDSFPQGLQVEIEQGFPYLLQQQLNRTSVRKIEVINLSVDAYGTDREVLLYAALGWQFQPDLVLLSLYAGNDVQDNEIDLETRRYGYELDRPFFTLSGTALQLHNSPVFDSALFSDSPVFAWLTALQAQQSPAPPENPPERPRVVESEPIYKLEYPVELGVYLSEDAYWSNAWKLTEALLLQMRDVVSLQNIPFAAFIIPDRRAVQGDEWSGTLATYGDLLPELRRADPTAPGTRLADFLSANAVPVLDLTWGLRSWAQGKPSERLYFYDNGHFNINGHAVVAGRIAEWLRTAKLVP